jgi:hypothetical protein
MSRSVMRSGSLQNTRNILELKLVHNIGLSSNLIKLSKAAYLSWRWV